MLDRRRSAVIDRRVEGIVVLLLRLVLPDLVLLLLLLDELLLNPATPTPDDKEDRGNIGIATRS